MNFPAEIQAICDAEAERFEENPTCVGNPFKYAFKKGFSACHSAYLEMAEKGFDEAAVGERGYRAVADPDPEIEVMGKTGAFVEGARWQHSRSVALLAELREENARLRVTTHGYVEGFLAAAQDVADVENKYKDLMSAKDASIADLEAKLGVAVEALETISTGLVKHARTAEYAGLSTRSVATMALASLKKEGKP
jgi:hypothetical protein